jgi:hypothetical protein
VDQLRQPRIYSFVNTFVCRKKEKEGVENGGLLSRRVALKKKLLKVVISKKSGSRICIVTYNLFGV